MMIRTMRPRSVMTTSWDDGHPLDQRVAELLTKHGLTGTFYIPLKNSRPVMDAKEIQKLSENFEIGAHTVHHVILTEVSQETAEAEIRGSKLRLEDLTGHTCESFCFPKGQFRRWHLDIVRQAGFRCARTVELLSTSFPVRWEGIDLIPTTVQARAHRWTAYARNCVRRLNLSGSLNFVLYARTRNWMEIARSMLIAVAQYGGVFHLWGHSWEIEEKHQWPQLESVFREMHDLQKVIACLPNSRISTATGVPSTANYDK